MSADAAIAPEIAEPTVNSPELKGRTGWRRWLRSNAEMLVVVAILIVVLIGYVVGPMLTTARLSFSEDQIDSTGMSLAAWQDFWSTASQRSAIWGSIKVSLLSVLFAGIVGFIDPPRDEAVRAVADCRSAGIAVKMITGDHAATAGAIASQLRLADDVRVVTGQDLEQVSDADLPALAESASVFARTTPEHKLRIVRALQSRGHTVAMTGDGVNDAPSLKQADIGVAMGHKGTEAAKEASGMVLADDNFASIAAAVHEGRAVYDNIRKVVAWTLPTNGGEVVAVVLAIAFGWLLPMTPAQILWINMVLTVTLGLALAFEPPERGVMARPPRHRDAPLVSPFMLWRIVLVSLLFSAGAFGIFAWAQARGHDIATARTMVVNMFCVMEIFYLFSVRYLHGSSFSLRGLRGTPAVLWAVTAVVIAQLAFTYTPWMQALFDTRPVPAFEGLVIVAIGAAMMLVLEAEKWLLRKLRVFDELDAASDAAGSSPGATS